jgi:hypothetical protein
MSAPTIDGKTKQPLDVEMMATDHDAIDERALRQLADEFGTEEIVELL